MNNFQIERILRSDNRTRKSFVGVFSSNTLPENPKIPSLLVANTSPSGHPGTHWILFYLKKDKFIYFDSLAGNFENYSDHFTKFVCKNLKGRKFVANSERLQAYNSNVCGHYVIFCSYWLCRGWPLKKIVRRLASVKKISARDSLVKEFVINLCK